MKKSELRQIIREEISKVVNENFNIQEEIKVGNRVIDGMNDVYKVVKVTTGYVILSPESFDGPISVFPEDFGSNVGIEDFWDYLSLSK